MPQFGFSKIFLAESALTTINVRLTLFSIEANHESSITAYSQVFKSFSTSMFYRRRYCEGLKEDMKS